MSNDPETSASYCRGKHWSSSNTTQIANKFNGRYLTINETFRGSVELFIGEDRSLESYEIVLPTLSVHNLVMGTMYLDLGEQLIVRNLNTREYAIVEFQRRGWTTKEKDYYKLEGKIYSSAPEAQKEKKNQHFPTVGG